MYKINIALIQETWLKDEDKLKLQHLKIFRNDRMAGAGGVAIGLTTGINYKRIKFNMTNQQIEIIALKLTFKDKTHLDIASVYVPPLSIMSIRDVQQIVGQLSRPFIICGDFNAKSAEWGCYDENEKGRTLMEACDELNMTIINDGVATHPQKPPRQSSVIDLAIVSDDIALSFSFKVIPNSCGSDHLPCQVKHNDLHNNTAKQRVEVVSICVKKFRENVCNINFVHFIQMIYCWHSFFDAMNILREDIYFFDGVTHHS